MVKDICVLICAYNEEKTIYDVVRRTRKFVNTVYVVDDGSTDRTFKEAKRAGAKVIKHKVNKGKGAALKTGFTYILSKGHRAVVVVDADGQHLPEEIKRFKKKFDEGYSFVVGRRDFSDRSVPLARKIGNRLYSSLLSLISGQKIYDPECGFRLYSSDLLPKLLSLSELSGFSYESEILIKLIKSGTKIGWADISTVYFPDRVSKIKPFRHLWHCARVCMRIV